MSQTSVNAIKVLGVDAINKAKSGHPGVVMGAAPMAYSLFANHLRVNPKKENWINRDRFVLFLLDKFRVLDVKSLTVLAGFSSVNYADIRLLKLAKYGYIKREKLVNTLPLVHWLTKKGYFEIHDEDKRIAKPVLATLEHEILIGRVASHLVLKNGVAVNQMITDRDLRVYQGKGKDNRIMKRKSDLLYIEPATKKRIAVEIELNYKGKSRTEQNYKNNQRFSDKQIWFISKRKKVLMNQLEELGADIFYIDDLENEPIEHETDYNIELSQVELIQQYFAGGTLNFEKKGSLLDKWKE